MIEYLAEYPLLLLFVVAALGYLFGNISISGSKLGVAGVLFVGLAFGALDPRLDIPEIILLLGLSVYVYSIGLNSGPAFFQSYRENGIRDFIFTISMLIFSGLVAASLWAVMGFSAATITGIYSGSTTNTAALAGVIDTINNTFKGTAAAGLLQQVVVGYSFSYPMGVLGGMIAILLMERLFRIDYFKEERLLRKRFPVGGELNNVTIKITNPEVTGLTLRDLLQQYDWNVTFGRIYQDGTLRLSHWDVVFNLGDLVMMVGESDDLEVAIQKLGQRVETALEHDRTEFDVRRIFVSNPMVVGRSIASLNLNEKYNAIITRIRRGDIEMLAHGETILELGDRIRFIARREDLKSLSEYFGDSYRESSRVNLFSFGLGIGLGLMLGSVEFTLGPEVRFKLGYAGGPLIVGLLLGALRRTGPIVWSLPYSANITLQQIGLLLLLSAIGVRSGSSFVQSISLDGMWIFLASAIISLMTAFAILFVGYKLIRMPFSLLMGMVSNQPAILDFASSRSNNRIPEAGFAMMFPLALISKIVIAQLLFLILK